MVYSSCKLLDYDGKLLFSKLFFYFIFYNVLMIRYLTLLYLRTWQYEDFIWGLFMAKYIFPGADASCPLGWVIDKLEVSGFEIQSVDTVGVHYSGTIWRWYQNWLKNKDMITEKYGKR
jgi:cyclopropane fatty-acyl-phospholipid synthase-like methyltransferase